MNRMPAWNDKQISRFNFRVGLFKRRGMAPDTAEVLADNLAFRDYDLDDRRVCVECENHQRGNTCFKRLPVSLGQLVRCNGFSFQKP